MGETTNPRDWPVELQNGVLTRSQALAAGFTDQVIATNLRQGRWQRPKGEVSWRDAPMGSRKERAEPAPVPPRLTCINGTSVL